MIIEIRAKTMLSTVPGGDGYFGHRYNFNIYRGCEHRCIYCDSRSECYGIENFEDVLVKVNAIELLSQELPRKRVKGVVGTGSMSDPYTYAEKQYQLTRQALSLLARYGFGVSLITKSDMVTRDGDVLTEVNRSFASVCFTLTTTDDELARKVEPGAPSPTRRLAAMRMLADQGLHVGVTLMPVLPFLEDHLDNIKAIVESAVDHGAQYILPWFGMSMRDRQRSYFYARLDELFPGLRRRYEARYGLSYGCPVPEAKRLQAEFDQLQQKFGFGTRVPVPQKEPQQTQLRLL
ncbi:MAG TPA: radical SAM protein [Anaerolineaceae bacterium]|nr:radical SAM protein [Anaerolineaceae bacterium]HPN53123.1 radical SAM protein [Anaerolineaceae bacterium]